MMYATLKAGAIHFHQSFRRSATIAFARLQILLGAVWAVLVATDLSPILRDPRYVTAWLVFSGIVTEYLRRRPRTCDPLPPVSDLKPTSGPTR